eukprot:scaffold2123_cov111-Isochrysis_galbana.AAC.8
MPPTASTHLSAARAHVQPTALDGRHVAACVVRACCFVAASCCNALTAESCQLVWLLRGLSA